MKSKEQRSVAAEKIQTAGYLYTLIGFMAALLAIDSEGVEFTDLLYPLGSSIATSILGWFFGGELQPRTNSSSVAGIQNHMDAVSNELQSFIATIKHHNQEYSRIVGETNTYLETMLTRQRSSVDNVTASSTQVLKQLLETAKGVENSLSNVKINLNPGLGLELVNSITNLKNNTSQAANAMASVENQAKDTAEYLKQAEILITQLESLLTKIGEA